MPTKRIINMGSIGRGQEKKNASSLLLVIILLVRRSLALHCTVIAIVLEWTENEMHQLVEC